MKKQRYTRAIRSLLTAASLLAILGGAQAQTTDTIAFQGRVLASSGAPVADGVYRVSFTLFDSESDGASLWTETNDAVAVAGGVFVAPLGSVEPFGAGLFAEDENLFLEIAIDVNNNGLDVDDVQSPRTPLNAAPVALHAKDAAMLGGVPAQDFPTSADVTSDIDALATSVTSSLAGKLGKTGPAYVVTEVTEDPVVNGANLLTAYAQAKALTPHGLPRSATNRAVVMLAPGRYDLGTGQLTLDTEFVDLVGLSTARDNQYIVGASNGPGTGVLAQTASDVRIENLVVECSLATGSAPLDPGTPAAYFPEPGLQLQATIVRNCRFVANDINAYSMRVRVDYNGIYQDCAGGNFAFGSGGIGGSATGIFTNCAGGGFSFGSSGGTANGVFTNCSGGSSFGGAGGIANGTFINCIGSGPSFGGDGGTASGKFQNCLSVGAGAFGGNAGTASGAFTDCTAGNNSFGSAGTASGDFIRCNGGNQSFGGLGKANGDFTSCTGGTFSFGGGTNAAPGQATGNFTDCTGQDFSFGGGFSDLSVDSYLIGCKMTGEWAGTFNGTMENCRWEISIPISVGNSARIYGSTFLAGVDLGNNSAGVTQCRAFGFLNAGNNLFGATNAAAFNISSLEVK